MGKNFRARLAKIEVDANFFKDSGSLCRECLVSVT